MSKMYQPMSDAALDEWERRVNLEIQAFLEARKGDEFSDEYFAAHPELVDPASSTAQPEMDGNQQYPYEGSD